ncbi:MULTISPECIES: 50S ribosomal protein L11 methyltransferase [Cysteiniphilum]|uniref:50S ribosomal protein L11 methyltransferase n=1 Tax=Cysteiniphilum TaxID=2056696 RepID=UPI0017814E72|nr:MULTISPECIES: 50S ribosomal protein L11 methyltransferase [Cysteiniphilum]
MLWKELSVTCLKANLQILEDYLLMQGACSVTYQDAKDQPILEPKPDENPLWDEVVLVALFTEEYQLSDIVTSLDESALKPNIIGDIHTREFADQDWTRTWMDDFKPMQFGRRLWIYPSWCIPEIHSDDQVNILLDPGLAFGTGTHQTTALCLKWLEQHVTAKDHVIDLGCGSGILAVAAKKLGAHDVIAIDNDPQAILATHANAEKNGINANFAAFLPDEAPKSVKADILIANILAGILIDLKEVIADFVKPHGKLALSGILQEQVDDIIKAFSPYFVLNEPAFKDEWTLISGIRKP